jgi:hypothetical protein
MTIHAGGTVINLHPKVFVVRLWEEPQIANSSVWRASIHHPESGQRWYFSGPNELANFLLEAGLDMAVLKDAFP